MILVTLGTQDKPFKRLLDAVEKEIKKGNIKEEVIVQAGITEYKSKYMKIFDLIPMDEFNELVENCDILITHGGVGSILTALKKNKKIIAVPRLSIYHEHDNDHQLEIVSNFDEEGYIIAGDTDSLDTALNKVKDFKPKTYRSNNSKFIKLITNYIDNN